MSPFASNMVLCLVMVACVGFGTMVNAGLGRDLEGSLESHFGASDGKVGRTLLALGDTGPVCSVASNCTAGLCCSKQGHCGKGASYCGIKGKKSNSQSPPITPATAPNPVTTTAPVPTNPTASSSVPTAATSPTATTSVTPPITPQAAAGPKITPALPSSVITAQGRKLRDVGSSTVSRIMAPASASRKVLGNWPKATAALGVAKVVLDVAKNKGGR